MDYTVFDRIGAMLFFYLIYYYGKYFYNLLYKKNREQIKNKNKELNTYRKKPIKNLEEQKQFLNKKYPYMAFNFNLKFFIGIIIGFIKFIALVIIFFNIITVLNIRISLYFSLIMWLIVPISTTIILMRYNLEDNDIVHFLRWK
jgi:hypothetical protein